MSEELPERGLKGILNLELLGLDDGDDERRSLFFPNTDDMDGVVLWVLSALDVDVADVKLKLSLSDASTLCRWSITSSPNLK